MPTYRRDPVRVKAHLSYGSKGGLFTDAPLKIQVPVRWFEKKLGSIGSETFVVGVFPMIFNDEYWALSSVLSMVRLLPRITETITIDDELYYQFHFDAGDQVFYSVDLVMDNNLPYYVYEEVCSKGRIPWFVPYLDRPKLFRTALKYAGLNLGNHGIMSLVLSTISRDPDDPMVLYRHNLKSLDEVDTRPPMEIPFKSVAFNTSNTVSRLIGSNFDIGVSSALIYPTESIDRIESALRDV